MRWGSGTDVFLEKQMARYMEAVGSVISQAPLGGPGAEVSGGLCYQRQAHQEVVVAFLGIDVEVHGLVRPVLGAGLLELGHEFLVFDGAVLAVDPETAAVDDASEEAYDQIDWTEND